MNVSRFFSVSKCGLFLLALMGGSWLGLLSGWADDAASDQTIQEARTAAQAWLAEIDTGKYEQSYLEGCTAFHNKVSKQQWITVLQATHPAIGNLVSRKESSIAYKPDGYEGMDGECMLIMYNSAFSKLGPTLEAVVLKREDGKWRGAGYNAQPQVTQGSE
jgi:hypothetical protein